jgi:hypothetical protein
MFEKYILLLLFLGIKILDLKAQTDEKIRFKPRYSQTTNAGAVIPISNLAETNNTGFNFGTVIEGDLSPHFFTRFTWDNFQFSYAQKAKIGNQLMDINGSNNGNAFYLSGGYYTDINKWKYYSFVGAGYVILNNPKIKTDLIDNANYTYLSNQNSSSLCLNWGVGVGYKMSSNEKLILEGNFINMPHISSSSFLTLQIGYRIFFTTSK